MNFGEQVRQIMQEKGIKQNELAREIGMSSSGISTALRDDSNPRLDTIKAISSALGVPLSDLMRPPDTKKEPAVAGPLDAGLRERITRLNPQNRDALSAYIDLLLISQESKAPSPGSPGSKP